MAIVGVVILEAAGEVICCGRYVSNRVNECGGIPKIGVVGQRPIKKWKRLLAD